MVQNLQQSLQNITAHSALGMEWTSFCAQWMSMVLDEGEPGEYKCHYMCGTATATEQEEEKHIWFAHILLKTAMKTEIRSMFRFFYEIWKDISIYWYINVRPEKHAKQLEFSKGNYLVFSNQQINTSKPKFSWNIHQP